MEFKKTSIKKQNMNEKDIISKHYSEMNAKRWAGIDKEERKRRMSQLAKKRWAKFTQKERSAYCKKIGLAGRHYDTTKNKKDI
ncbi:MAG: hypothetical protein ABIJ17_01060 [Patescibacteria group bacterium]